MLARDPLTQPLVGQFRFRSTPRAFLRVRAAAPSGFIVGMIQTSASLSTGSWVRT
jgi:hypothetical protein